PKLLWLKALGGQTAVFDGSSLDHPLAFARIFLRDATPALAVPRHARTRPVALGDRTRVFPLTLIGQLQCFSTSTQIPLARGARGPDRGLQRTASRPFC